MTDREAERLAARIYGDTLDRYGFRLLDHVRRVADAVPGEARTVAWLHEAFEFTALTPQELRAAGVSAPEIAAVDLLTRHPEDHAATYQAHIDRIAEAPGAEGQLARTVKLADLRDRLHYQQPGFSPARPPYTEAIARLERQSTAPRETFQSTQ